MLAGVKRYLSAVSPQQYTARIKIHSISMDVHMYISITIARAALPYRFVSTLYMCMMMAHNFMGN